jgi:hypothetical protein
LQFLRSELVARVDRPLAHRLARGEQLALGALGERLHSNCHEEVVCRAQLRACVDTTALPAQPLPVEQVGSRQLGPQPRTA